MAECSAYGIGAVDDSTIDMALCIIIMIIIVIYWLYNSYNYVQICIEMIKDARTFKTPEQ